MNYVQALTALVVAINRKKRKTFKKKSLQESAKLVMGRI